LIKSFSTVGANTLLSRVLGFVRDLVIARLFGADAGTDAFFVAFKIPNVLRRMFAEGAFAMAFVPVLSEYRETRSFDDLKRFVDHMAGTLAVALLAVSLAGVAAAPVVVALFAPGWVFGEGGDVPLAVDMLRLTFPYILFISMTAFAAGILNTHDRFGVPAFTPVLLNLVLIACALWLAPRLAEPIMALAWGVLIAGVAQFAFQLPFLHQLRLLPRLRPVSGDEGVRRVLRLMMPALFGASVTQLSLLLDTLLASVLREGSISWLYYSDRLVEFPVGLIGVALGVVILPRLSRLHARQSAEEFSSVLDWALRWVLLFGAPAAVGLAVLAGPMVATLFQSEVFDAEDVVMARVSLVAYSLGVMSFLAVRVLAPGFFARKDMVTPVRIGIRAVAVGATVNLAIVATAHSVPGFYPLAHGGLALGTVVAASIDAFLLLRMLRREGAYRPSPGWDRLVARTLAASLAMACFLAWGVGDLGSWIQAPQSTKVVWLAVMVAAGAVVYFAALWLAGVRFRHFRAETPAARG